jgi:P-type Cu2+ transporter
MEDHTQHHNHHAGTVREAEPGTAAHASGHAGHRTDDDHVVHSHGQHAGHSTAMFKNRFWLTLALSVPVVYFSPMFAHLLGYMPPDFPGATWIPRCWAPSFSSTAACRS